MSKLGSHLLLALAIVMILAVTVFGPERITQDVLSKIVPERKTQQDKDVVVRLKLDKPLLPGENVQVKVAKMADLAGNETYNIATTDMESDDTAPPALKGAVLMADPAKGQITAVAIFGERLRPKEALSAGGYVVECPPGQRLSLTEAAYDEQQMARHIVVLRGRADVNVGDPFVLSIAKTSQLKDLAGNALVLPQKAEGKVVALRPLPTVTKAVQDLQTDPTGRTVALTFSLPMDPQAAAEACAYRTEVGGKAKSVTLDAAGTTAHVVMADPVIPGEALLAVEGLVTADAAAVPLIPAVPIQAGDDIPPKPKALRVEAVAGKANDVVVVTFDECVVEADAIYIGNYSLTIVSKPLKGAQAEEQIGAMALPAALAQTPANIGAAGAMVAHLTAPKAEEVALAGSRAEYDESGRAVTITLTSVDLVPGSACKLVIKGVRDAAGNAMAAEVCLDAKVAGDTEPPSVARALQDLSHDSTGATLLVRFSEAVDMETADTPDVFTFSDGIKPVVTRVKGDKAVYVLVDQPVIPGETTLTVGQVRDLAGNAMAQAKGVAITPQEQNRPSLTRLRGTAFKGIANDTVAVGFSEPVVPRDATNVSNYQLESPKGTRRSLAGAELCYDPIARSVQITLAGIGDQAVNFKKGEPILIRVSNVKDLGGNPVAEGAVAETVVEGDSTPPGIRRAFLNNLPGVDPTGATVDVHFTEAVEPATVDNLDAYTVLKGPEIKSLRTLGDGQAVRITFAKPVAVGRGNYGYLIVAVVVVMCYMILVRLTKDLASATRAVLRVIVVVVVVGAIALSLTSKKELVRLRAFGLTDLAGNPARSLSMPPIVRVEKDPPRVEAARVVLPPRPEDPAEVVITFSESVDPRDAVQASHYQFDSPPGQALALANAKISYLPADHSARILLPRSEGRLKVGETFLVSVTGVRDIAGNPIAGNSEAKGQVGGDLTPPAIVAALHRWEELDLIDYREEVEDRVKIKGYGAKIRKGFTCDIDFSEPMDPVAAEEADNYLVFGGPRCLSAMVDEDDPKKVWVSFAGQLVPRDTKMLLRNLRDLAGNVMPIKTDLTVAAEELEPPRVIRSQTNAVSGVANDTVFVTFNEQVVAGDATNRANYQVESPQGTVIDLAGCKITYNAPTSTTTIVLTNGVNLKTGASYRIVVQNIRDVSGNPILAQGKDNVASGNVRGDRSRPLARLVKVIQRLSKDSTGCTVDVKFEEAVAPAVAGKPENYSTNAGHQVLAVEIASVEKERDEALLEAIEELKPDVIKAHMAALAAMPTGNPRKSRMSGTAGNKEARDYVVKALQDLGFKPKIESLKVVVPIEDHASMTAKVAGRSETFKLAAIWPNKVKTCSLPEEGLKGHMVFGGTGELAEFNGNPMKGAVVLMDFGCAKNYFHARMLGASCILFYDDGNVTSEQGTEKFIEVPADIPRFWVDKKSVPRLKELCKANAPVELSAKVDWQELETWNVYACLEGADEFMPPRGDEEPRKWKDQIVVLEGYYDSISVVPELAPGADSSSGIAALLELARFLKKVYPPKYSVLFLATSGHFQGLSGINDFVYRHIRKSDYYLDRMAVMDKIELLFYKDVIARLPKTDHIRQLEEEEFLRVKRALPDDVKAGRAVHLWHDEYALLDKDGKVVVDSKGEAEIRKMALRLFVGLDLSSHNDQVASFAEGTFYNYGWRTDNYKQNALAPFAKKFFEYYENAFPPGPDWEAKAKTRDITYLETRGYVNAVTPSKRSWRHYMHAPLGLDHEAVTWVGHFAISMATPQDMRELTDTPNDTMAHVDVDNVYTQTRTLACLLGQAGRDDEFIPDSKLELKDMGHNMKGSVVWFDRNVNFFVPKAPVPGAIMTYQVSGDRARSGVRTLMCAMTADGSPHGGDERLGWRVDTITSDSTRIRIYAWHRGVVDPQHSEATVRTRYGKFKYALHRSKEDPSVWETGQVSLTRRVHTFAALTAPGIICGVIALICLGLVYFIKDIPRPAAYICYSVTVLVALIFLTWAVKVAYTKANDPRLEPKQEDLNLPWDYAELADLRLGNDNDMVAFDEPVDVGFGSYEGQFFYDVRRLRWTVWPFAYKLDDGGDIVFAADRGQEGDKTYPIRSHYGWWETNVLQVLFPCRAMSVFDTVDSRYLTALDYSSMLGPDDAVPQWFGVDQVLYQSRREGKTVEVAVFYAKPGQRIKILMSTGLVGVKYLLTNAPEELFTHKAMVSAGNVSGSFGEFYDVVYPDEETRPSITDRERRASLKLMARGRGYPIERGIVFNPAFEGTKDMWIIDDVRMKELAKFGVKNERIEHLHERAKAALESADKHLEDKQYDRFMGAAREAWGLEARGYPDVKKTANDTVKGIVFYFILLLPFSYFMERLLFGFGDVRKRLIAFGGIFVLVFLVLRMVHPAFKLSSSPYIIFLAFITFALGGVVLFMVMAKFNQEVQKIKRAAAGIHEVDVGRLSATYAAINLGISNLRKRKVRTSLTAATLTLLTFTVLSFTSVSASLKYYKLPRDNRPTYQGSLVRDRNWKGLQESVLKYLESAFEGKAEIVPRSWKLARISTEKEYIAFQKVGADKPSFANALVGFTPRERIATGIDQFLIGENSRWFKPGDREVCILPNDMAALVDISEDDVAADPKDSPKVRMLGADFTVIGIIDSDRFNRTRDLDDEKLTPVDMVSEGQRMRTSQREDPDLQASEPIESFVHLESSNVMLLPYDYVMSAGGTLRSVAITRFKLPKIGKQIEEFMSRVALTVFVGERDNVTVYSSIGATSLGGLANLAIPILIAALIVLNTMLGSVYERFREIGIFSSVGLAPTHIAALFLAEAAVFATVGAVMGYLIGQVVTMALSRFGLLSGMNLNYSSLSAISSTLVVMATVFLSTIYPARKAASMAVPDVTRKWKFPEPEGDRWVFDFPFTIGGAEVVGMYAYLAKIFESYGEGSTGGFVAEDVKLASCEHEGMKKYTITMRTWLAPYDLGISQDVILDGIPSGEHSVYRVEVILQRLSGDVASWRRINRGFLNVLRKRFLVWRTVSPEEKVEYREQGHQALVEATAAG